MRIDVVLRRRLSALLHRASMDRDLDEELRLHLELEARALERAGASAHEAQRLARARFGGVGAVKESVRDARGVRPLEDAGRDVRYALRSLRHSPAFALAMIATLAIGIGASTAMFSVVHGVLLRALPYPGADRIAVIWETDRNSGTTREPASVPDFFDYAAQTRAFDALGGVVETTPTLVGDDAVQVNAAAMSWRMFDVLAVRPALGRAFDAREDAPGGPPVAVLSDAFWRARFGGDPGVVGRTIRLDDQLYSVIGVLPPDVRFPREHTDLWIPLQLSATSAPRSRHFVAMFGRLADGVSLATAQREMSGIARRLEAAYPRDNRARGVNVESLRDVLVGGVRRPLYALLAGVGLLLLIACANAANLLLARNAARAREVALRAALGASRQRLAQQFTVEALVLSVAAAAFGVALASGALRLLLALAPASLPRRDAIAIDAPVLMVTLGVAVLVALVFGLLPSLRRQTGDAAAALEDRSAAGSLHRSRLRRALVVGEVAVALVLASAAGLVLRTLANVQAVNPGFTAEHVVELRYTLPSSRYPQDYSKYPAGWPRTLAWQRDVQAAVRALPGVRTTAIAANDPLEPGFTNSFVIVGREAEAARGQAELATRPVSASYFATVGVPLVRGRSFTSTDDASAPPVVVINQAAADRYFRGRDPIGQRIRFWGQAREIIGVVGNERFAGLTETAPPAMYPPVAQAPMTTGTLLVRAAGDAREVLPRVREAMRAIDPLVAPFGARTLDEALAQQSDPQRFMATLLGAFGAVALVLALVGIHGVISYTVAQRTREIGIRVALGASRGTIIRGTIREALVLALRGTALGAVGALLAGRLLRSQLFGVSPSDPVMLAGAVAAVLAVAIVGSMWPARRAASVAPAVALREE